MELPSCSLFSFNQIPPATTTPITTSTSASNTPRRLLVAASGSTAASGSAIVCPTSVGSLTVAAAIGDSASFGFAIFGSRGCSAADFGSVDLGLAVSGSVTFASSGVFASTISPITLDADVDVFSSGAGLARRSATTGFWSVASRSILAQPVPNAAQNVFREALLATRQEPLYSQRSG